MNHITPLALAKQARELIADPERWGQRAYARNGFGVPVASGRPDAVCWCSIGAVTKVTRDAEDGLSPEAEAARSRVVWALEEHTDGTTVIQFNDNHTHEEVLAVWDAAIKDLEAEHAAQ